MKNCNESAYIPDAPRTARPYSHTHLVETEPKREIRASVRLTEQAHSLLVDMAKGNKVSMKTVGSEAINALDGAPKLEKMYLECIEQLKFEVRKYKELTILYTLLVGVSALVLGFVIGVRI